VRHIPTIARGTVITTNFDCVLEAAFKHTNRPFDRVYSGPCIRDASRAVHLNERCLLKLHGDYRDSENRILTLTEYIREYGGATPDDINIELDLPKVLSQALASRPFLFLGCSLKTDRTIGVISRLAKRYPNIVHFALLSSEEAVTTRLEQLDSWNIRPLFFQSGHFEQIEKFLSCLAQHCRQQAALSLEDMAIEAQHVSPQRELRLNGYKAFYFRRTRKLGIRALSALSKVPEREIRRLERVRMKGNHLGSHCFAMCEPEILRKIENALECHGKLIAGQPDDFLTMYMLYYQQCRGTSINTEKDEDQLNLSFETKAVVFDFDGTLTVRTDDETTWEKIWVKLGYKIDNCSALHSKYTNRKMSHQEWCDITRDHFREAHFSRKDLKDVAKSITLIPGTREVLESLRARDIKLYILSGSIKQIIYEVLGDLRGYFEDIRANDISFDSSGIIRKISGTLYDFEGKATFLSRIIAENEYSPFDVLFVGNSCNDIFASQSGARTLCVNPRGTDGYKKEHWTYLLKGMDNLTEILRCQWFL
jgi:HAD superfamily phosphoserine phosphatase-like hydrolase